MAKLSGTVSDWVLGCKNRFAVNLMQSDQWPELNKGNIMKIVTGISTMRLVEECMGPKKLEGLVRIRVLKEWFLLVDISKDESRHYNSKERNNCHHGPLYEFLYDGHHRCGVKMSDNRRGAQLSQKVLGRKSNCWSSECSLIFNILKFYNITLLR